LTLIAHTLILEVISIFQYLKLKNKDDFYFTKCVIVCNKIFKLRKLNDKYFVDEMETQLREKPLLENQTQDIHYSKDKASYKAVALTYPYAVVVP
jgi:hypothetical protein